MDEKLKDRDVLLVKEKNSDKLKVVAGINPKKGKLETLNPDNENHQDFMKIDRRGNALDNFFENFNRQFKNPTDFLFFKVPVDRMEEVAKDLQKALKNPDTPENRRFLDMHKVEPQSQKQYAINPELVQWGKFERYGITREGLEKSGNLEKLLDYQKTNLMPVAIKFDDETLRTDARFSLKKMEDGSLAPSVHLIRHKPDLERPYFGVWFTEEDKKNLLETGNLGRVVNAEFKQGEKISVYLSLDKQTNELVACRTGNIKAPENYKGVQLSDEQKQKLENGEKIKIEGMTSIKGKKFNGEVQFNADKRYFELIFNSDRKLNQNNMQSETAEIRIPKTLLGAALSEKQQADLKAEQTIYVSGMKNKGGQEFNAYVKINTEKGKLEFLKWNPDKTKTQGEEVTSDNAQQQRKEEQKKSRGTKI
jgi:hypothetical protein